MKNGSPKRYPAKLTPVSGKGRFLAGNLRSAIFARPVFPRKLRPKLIQCIRRECGVQGAVHGVGEVFFNRVCASGIRVNIEGSVLLAGVGIVAAQADDVLRTGIPVDLAECRLSVVGAFDRRIPRDRLAWWRKS